MDLEYLRQATRPEHEATESTVSLMDPALRREDYICVLQNMYGAVRTWDDWAAENVPPAHASLLHGRRRSPLIEADLAYLGASVPSAVGDGGDALSVYLHTDANERDAAFLGAMYVIEGSTLGGQYIAKHVEQTLNLEPGLGNSYFRGYGDQTGAMWKAFKAVLAAVPDTQTELVVRSAKHMFGFFAANMTDTTQKGA
jgi:heme oxygenase